MPYMRYKSGGKLVWRANCRHCQVLDEYWAARDAREALRESGMDHGGSVAGTAGSGVGYYQLSDEEFNQLHPPVLLKDWLIDRAREWRQEEEAADTTQ